MGGEGQIFREMSRGSYFSLGVDRRDRFAKEKGERRGEVGEVSKMYINSKEHRGRAGYHEWERSQSCLQEEVQATRKDLKEKTNEVTQ